MHSNNKNVDEKHLPFCHFSDVQKKLNTILLTGILIYSYLILMKLLQFDNLATHFTIYEAMLCHTVYMAEIQLFLLNKP